MERCRTTTGVFLTQGQGGYSRKSGAPVRRWPTAELQEPSDLPCQRYPSSLLTSCHGLFSACCSGFKIEAVKVHDFRPRGHEVIHKLLLGVFAGVDLRECSQLGVGTEHKIHSTTKPANFTRLAISPFEEVIAHGRLLPFRVHVEQIHEEVIGQRLRLLCQNTQVRKPDVRVQHSQASDKHSHLRS
jgi:hypothetical protein